MCICTDASCYFLQLTSDLGLNNSNTYLLVVPRTASKYLTYVTDLILLTVCD